MKLVPEGIGGWFLSTDLLKILSISSRRAGSSMGYCGAKTINEFSQSAKFIQITTAGVKENHPHEVRIMKESLTIRY